MKVILHGDDSNAARIRFSQLLSEKRAGAELRSLDDKSTPEDIIQTFESSSLFEQPICIAGENFLSSVSQRKKEQTRRIDVLLQAPEAVDILLWESKPLTPAVVAKVAKRFEVQTYRIPKVIFTFLDGVRPNNHRSLLALMDEILIHTPPEVVFALLVRRVRELIIVKDGAMPQGISSWQADKLTSQMRSFTMEQLLHMHSRLYILDRMIKTGATPRPLAQHLKEYILYIS